MMIDLQTIDGIEVQAFVDGDYDPEPETVVLTGMGLASHWMQERVKAGDVHWFRVTPRKIMVFKPETMNEDA